MVSDNKNIFESIALSVFSVTHNLLCETQVSETISKHDLEL